MKSLFIAEKPSVAREFAAALHEKMSGRSGYMESEHYVVTWCVGHLVTMSYPDKYDESLKKWSLDTLPFLPDEFKYEIIPAAAQQFGIVKELLCREDVGTIFVCTDAGREGEYIYRLVAQEAKVTGKTQKRVWIDSQTEEEIIRGIKEARPLSDYDHLADSAYLRAKEDYLMGINFSRVLSLKYAYGLQQSLGTEKYRAVSVGRVMTCVLGMVVRREREIRDFVKKPFFRVIGTFEKDGNAYDGEWRVCEGSRYEGSPLLYKDNGFSKKETAEELINILSKEEKGIVESIEKKKETKNPPLLYNLAELQNDCSKLFRISPDQTLNVVQSLYEKRLVTYPRTDARVLSSAVAKEIEKNIRGLVDYAPYSEAAREVLSGSAYKNIGKTRYTNDKMITDHYAIIPTGSAVSETGRLKTLEADVYRLIVSRFLSIFCPPAVYEKVTIRTKISSELFQTSSRVLKSEGYLKLRFVRSGSDADEKDSGSGDEKERDESTDSITGTLPEALLSLRKGDQTDIKGLEIKEGETKPPKRYTSGSMILAMENAGQLIEDEELRAQIKGSGIGTSATRAEILKKLANIEYLKIAQKTQVIYPTQMGEMVYDVVDLSIRSLLNPELTASWEKGLSYVAEGSVSSGEYMVKLKDFVSRHTEAVKRSDNLRELRARFAGTAQYYRKSR